MKPGRITGRLAQCRANHRCALIPFFTAGFPRPSATLAALQAADQAGCDLLELGVPFSDPLADGPAIQHSSHVALKRGVTLDWILELVHAFRRHSDTPVVLMGYMNPFLCYGENHFCCDARSAGVDGLIVPDLPPDEGGALHRAAHRYGLSMIYLVAPTTRPERVRFIARHCTDLCYCVSLVGVTGARAQVAPDTERYLKQVRRLAGKPIVVGFGISTSEQVRRLRDHADGLVMGSALVPLLAQGGSSSQLRARIHAALKPLVRAATGP